MNPYLAAAMFLAAGLDGIEQDLDPGDPQLENMYELSDAELDKRGVRQLAADPARGGYRLRGGRSWTAGDGR